MFKSLYAINNILLSQNGKTIPRNSNLLDASNNHVCFLNNGDDVIGFNLNLETSNSIPNGYSARLKDNSGTVLFTGANGVGNQIKLTSSITLTHLHSHPTDELVLEIVSTEGKNVASTPVQLKLYYVPVDRETKVLYRKGMPIEVLDYLCKPSTNKDIANNDPDILTSVASITNDVFNDIPPRYDVWYGASYYGNYNNWNNITFHHTYYAAARYNLLNCYDCAAALQYQLQLDGRDVRYCFMQPFGYIRQTYLVGRAATNNPFNQDITARRIVTRTSATRTGFGNHAFVRIQSTYGIVDACAGPHTGGENINTYIGNAIDTTIPYAPTVNTGDATDVGYYAGVTNVDLIKPVMYNSYRHKIKDAAFNEHHAVLSETNSGKINLSVDSIKPFLAKNGWKIYYQETVAGQMEGLHIIALQRGDKHLTLKLYASNETNQHAINRFFDLALNIQSVEHGLTKVENSIFHQHVERKHDDYQVNIILFHNIVLHLFTNDDNTDLSKLTTSFSKPLNAALHASVKDQQPLNIKQSFNEETKQYRIDLLDAKKDDVLEFYDVNNNCRMIDCQPGYIIFEKAKEMPTVLKVWSMNNSNLSISNTKRLQIK